ncbi:uncharacterized protein LOC133309335 [Gastrolobium bilobum]|uniref:uncharacterized protein LOC133309335 n=1 Tax=Gastrolobium bilobum TaxID=150636 RepID=UPI002AB1970F|nr:uncharacterized protein LOC133309335 [Gastrolobium bilobum]
MKIDFPRFGSGDPKFEDPLGSLAKLQQLHSVVEFQSAFELLARRIPDLTPLMRKSLFISGLKSHIRRAVLVHRPLDVFSAFAYAKIYEEQFIESRSTKTWNPRPNNTTPQPIAATPLTTIPSTPQPRTPLPLPSILIKRLSPAEMLVRREKNLCYNCDERFVPGHHCKGRATLLYLDGTEEEPPDCDVEPPPDPDPQETDALSTTPAHEISFNALFGHHSANSFRMVGKIVGQSVQIFVDGGSTHNFITLRMASHLHLTLHAITPFKVRVGNGDALLCSGSCKAVIVDIQTHHFSIDLYVLELQGANIVLGVQWLSTLGPVETDYSALTMSFVINDWQSPTSDQTPHLPRAIPELEKLLDSFSNVFTGPSSLPQTEPITTPSHSSFSSPVLLVKKKDGTWRFCVDYRALNAITVQDKFLIPTIDELLDELHGAIIFSKLDLRSGYHQIKMHTDDIAKTAFRTHHEHFEFVVMPFGLSNALSTFQATMNTIFLAFLRSMLRAHTLFAKREKCSFVQSEIPYLGNVITGYGVSPDPEKLKAISEWPVPSNVTQVRSFLGISGYYCKFIERYASLAAPLTDLLSQSGFVWTTEASKAFEHLKQLLMTAPILALPNFSESFVVETDASGVGIGRFYCRGNDP